MLLGIGFLIWKQTWIQSIFNKRYLRASILVASFFAFGLEFYVLHHLPVVDCLPYQVGKNIIDQRKQPPPPPGSTVMFVYNKKGTEIEFPADKFPTDFNSKDYQFVRRYDSGEIPQAPIQGFVLYGSSGADTTDAILASERIFLLFSENIQYNPNTWETPLKAINQLAKEKSIPLALITNRPDRWTAELKDLYPRIILLSCDRTPIRTAARVNPTIYEIRNGTIQGKWAMSDWSIQRSLFQ